MESGVCFEQSPFLFCKGVCCSQSPRQQLKSDNKYDNLGQGIEVGGQAYVAIIDVYGGCSVVC